MRQIAKRLRYLVGDEKVLENICSVPALPLFSEPVVDFLDKLSQKLLDNRCRQYSDVIAYGFWLRRASLEQMKKSYESSMERLGRGLVFHITPSNIPVQFAVSLAYAMLSGNASVARVSSKEFLQVDIICKAIREVISESCPSMAPYICIVRYGHDDVVTEKLSALCDARLIWGGNKTVNDIRRAKVSPRCLDIGFADRYSIAVICADEYLRMNHEHIARDFYNDTYFSDQNACSSPRLVVWTGEKISEAKQIFWRKLKDLVDERYEMSEIASSDKLLNTALCAANYEGVREIKEDNTLVRLNLPRLYPDIMRYKGNCGYFMECDAENLEDIVPILKKECQTIVYIGNVKEELQRIIKLHGVRGVDRIVPVGRAMDISLVWDGIDMPLALSRCITN
ncbi:MAG: long-chain-fatty-acyl-CoA reductase [Selenomonadaceae bacterium]|nr:long-chain-fatty-acyl-CoA reductase [Selenomonadaceae bacterium]